MLCAAGAVSRAGIPGMALAFLTAWGARRNVQSLMGQNQKRTNDGDIIMRTAIRALTVAGIVGMAMLAGNVSTAKAAPYWNRPGYGRFNPGYRAYVYPYAAGPYAYGYGYSYPGYYAGYTPGYYGYASPGVYVGGGYWGGRGYYGHGYGGGRGYAHGGHWRR